MQATRECNQIFKGLKWKPYQPRTLNIVKLSFKCEEEINIPSEKQKLRQYITSHPDFAKKKKKNKKQKFFSKKENGVGQKCGSLYRKE